MEQRRWALFAALIMGGVGVRLRAQARAPKVYSITERNSMMMANMTIRAVRDGSKEVIDKTYPPIAANPKGYHSRTFYDFKAHKSYLVDLKVPGPCGAVTYTSSHAPWFDDPFAGGADNPLHSLPPKARHVGVAKIAGLTADELQAPDPDQPGATVRIWIARQPRLVVKMQSVAPHGIADQFRETSRVPVCSARELPGLEGHNQRPRREREPIGQRRREGEAEGSNKKTVNHTREI